MEDNIENYTDEKFNPAIAAQKFFASYGENEITRKLNDMSKLQQSIENILKQNVRDNYLIFLQANDQIGHVGQEMSDLKHLIENTRKLIQDVRGTKLSESRAMRANSLLPVLQSRLLEDDRRREERQQPETASGLPAWLTRAPDELAQFIVEQQYQKAVSIVLKCRLHVESLQKSKAPNLTVSTDGSGNSTLTRALDVLESVNRQGAELANTIKRSLMTIPNSPLWGMTEQTKRLKLLIALEEYDIAGEGFSLIKQQHIQRALNSVEFSSNIVVYARDLGKSFLTELLSSVKTFFELFEDQLDDSDILSILLEWTQIQTSDFIRFLCRPLRMAVAEASTLMLFHFRDPMIIARTAQRATSANSDNAASERVSPVSFSYANTEMSSSGADGSRKSLTPPRSRSMIRSSIIRPGAAMPVVATASSGVAISNSSSANLTNGIASPLGGISLVIQAIVEILSDAHDYEEGLRELMAMAGFTGKLAGSHKSTTSSNSRSSISTSSATSATFRPFPMIATCAFYLLPELRKMFVDYAEDIIQEVATQVQQDTWGNTATSTLEVCPSILAEVTANTGNSEGEITDVSSSYLWMIAVMNHLFSEIIVLLNKSAKVGGYGSDARSMVLLEHLEVSELEPAAISIILRLLVRYLVELESLDTSLFTRSQAHCYASTIDAIHRFLVKSVQMWCDKLFVVERMQLMTTPPSAIFRTIITRLNRIKQTL